MPRKRTTISVTEEFYTEYNAYFQAHKKALIKMEITDVSKLIRYSANLGLVHVEELVKKFEK